MGVTRSSVLLVWAICAAVTSGLHWTSPSSLYDNVTIPACAGQTVDLPWLCAPDPAEHVHDIEWYFSPENGTGEVFLGTYIQGRFFPDPSNTQHIEFIQNAGIRLVGVESADSGTYRVRVNVNLHGSVIDHTQSAHLVVTEESITTDNHLHAHFEGARFMDSSQEHQLNLVCGIVTPTWLSKVNIVWTTPLNQTLPSTYQKNGQFALAVPNPFVSGDYSCSIADAAPAMVCIPSDSPLRDGALVHLDGVEGRIALMDSRQRQMAQQIQTLQAEKNEITSQLQAMQKRDGIRLAGGASPNIGRLEVFINGTWGTVCDTGFGTEEAQVACRQLGFSTNGRQVLESAPFDQGFSPVYMNHVQCDGTENELLDCSFDAIDVHSCSHNNNVGIGCDCYSENICGYAIRLVGGSAHSGRVEISVNGVWGTVCDDSFDNTDATVVCRQLGLPTGNAVAYSEAHFGVGSGPIHMDNVRCSGTETNILDCPYNGLDVHNCHHSEDVGVSCA